MFTFFEANKNQFFRGFVNFIISRTINNPLSDAFHRIKKSIRVVKREWFKVTWVSFIYYNFPSHLNQKCRPTVRFSCKEWFFTAKWLTPLPICLKMIWTPLQHNKNWNYTKSSDFFPIYKQKLQLSSLISWELLKIWTCGFHQMKVRSLLYNTEFAFIFAFWVHLRGKNSL